MIHSKGLFVFGIAVFKISVKPVFPSYPFKLIFFVLLDERINKLAEASSRKHAVDKAQRVCVSLIEDVEESEVSCLNNSETS